MILDTKQLKPNVVVIEKNTEHFGSACNLMQEEEENFLLYQKKLEKLPELNQNRHPLVVLNPVALGETQVLSEERKYRYLQHVRQLIVEVAEDIQSKKNTIPVNDPCYPPLNMPILDEEKRRVFNEIICEKCKGACCLNGGDTAFLQTETIKRYMTKNSWLTPEQVLQNYKETIAEQTCVMSCINHTEKGCGLPQEMRSDMCNNFYCSTLKELNTTFSKQETIPEGVVVILAPPKKVVKNNLEIKKIP